MPTTTISTTTRILLCFLIALFSIFTQVASSTSVIRSAPDVTWQQDGKTVHLASFHGQPVLLLISPSPKSWNFYRQLNALKSTYERLAAEHLVCLAAFTKEEGMIHSNIPFIIVDHGSTVGKSYSADNRFALALIGPDGNLDCFSTHVLAGQRIDDLINASFVNQTKLRRP